MTPKATCLEEIFGANSRQLRPHAEVVAASVLRTLHGGLGGLEGGERGPPGALDASHDCVVNVGRCQSLERESVGDIN